MFNEIKLEKLYIILLKLSDKVKSSIICSICKEHLNRRRRFDFLKNLLVSILGAPYIWKNTVLLNEVVKLFYTMLYTLD